MTCQCGFIGYNKCITLVGNVDNVEALHLWRKSIYGKSLCLLLNLATNLKFWKILKSITISMDLHSLRGKPKIININCKAYDKQNSTCAYNLISLYLLSLFGFYQCLTYVMLFFQFAQISQQFIIGTTLPETIQRRWFKKTYFQFS